MIATSGHQMGRPEDQPPRSIPSPDSSSSSLEEKYGLRPRTIIKRLQQERSRQQVSKAPKGQARPKSRPAPLSKYRRKTANARERHRMREINNAFESLRKVLPEALDEEQTASSNITKISTLRLAVSYIRALTDVLEDESDPAFHSLQCSAPGTFLRAAPPQPFPLPHLHLPQAPHLLGYFSTSSHMTSSSPSISRSSLSSSSSDLEDLLSDDSSLLEDNFDVFHDIPSLPCGDPLDILLEAERGVLSFTPELCN